MRTTHFGMGILLYIFRTPLYKNMYGGWRLLVNVLQLNRIFRKGHINVSLNKAGLFEGSFLWGGGQFDPPFIFQEELI